MTKIESLEQLKDVISYIEICEARVQVLEVDIVDLFGD